MGKARTWGRGKSCVCSLIRIWLYNPRRQRVGPCLVGRTAVWRETIEVREINDEEYLQSRATLIINGAFPPA